MPPVKRTYEKVRTVDELMTDTPNEEGYDDDHTRVSFEPAEQQPSQNMEELEYEAQMETGEKASGQTDQKPRPNMMMKKQVAILQKKFEAQRAATITNDTPIYSQNQLNAIKNDFVQRVEQDMIRVASISAGIGIIVGFLGARYFFSGAAAVATTPAASVAELAETVV